MEVLQSIRGVYSITIDAEKGIVKVNGKVDPNILLMVLAKSGQHAEILWAKLENSKGTTESQWYNRDQRSLPAPNYYSQSSLPAPDYYSPAPLPPASYFPQAPKPVADYNMHYDDDNCCSVM
ncbi:hypothetical protein L1049_000148 [Liquidambar formosana]|uniref:HMA domain-containing protein n=1 Tax=Liquidambar formosana TaxID=63359 RepID=A0AAP0NC90_LIQFO